MPLAGRRQYRGVTMTRCPSPEELQQFLAGRLPGPRAGAVETHVQGCGGCQGVLERLTGKAPGVPAGAGSGSGQEFLRRLAQDAPTMLPTGQAGPAGPTPAGLPAIPGYEVLAEL